MRRRSQVIVLIMVGMLAHGVMAEGYSADIAENPGAQDARPAMALVGVAAVSAMLLLAFMTGYVPTFGADRPAPGV